MSHFIFKLDILYRCQLYVLIYARKVAGLRSDDPQKILTDPPYSFSSSFLLHLQFLNFPLKMTISSQIRRHPSHHLGSVFPCFSLACY